MESRGPQTLPPVGALALPTPGVDAVGSVRLRCEPDGLTVDLLRVARFVAGFAVVVIIDLVSKSVGGPSHDEEVSELTS